jgi:CRISPR-associated endonuclease/helicase Cas3
MIGRKRGTMSSATPFSWNLFVGSRWRQPILTPPIPEKGTLRLFLAIAAGHRGRMPARNTALNLYQGYGDESDRAAVAAIARAVIKHFGWSSGTPDHEGLEQLSYILHGFITLADWLGSDEQAFMPRVEPMPLPDYWAGAALPGARSVVDRIRPALFAPRPAPEAQKFRQVFAHLAVPGRPLEPSPLQYAIERFCDEGLPDGRFLIVIEYDTGAGKTEAADFLAHRLVAAGKADGVYVGLPTMATADQAFLRKEHVVEALAGRAPDVVLAHSRRHRNAKAHVIPAREEATPSALAALDWFTRSSKRALLAGLGVGTVDQALLGALRAPYAHPPRWPLAKSTDYRRGSCLRHVYARAH